MLSDASSFRKFCEPSRSICLWMETAKKKEELIVVYIKS